MTLTAAAGLCSACSVDRPQNTAGPNSPEQAELLITEAGLRRHVARLSSDELQGRGVGTEGDRMARAYLAEQLQRVGCSPGAAGSGRAVRL